MNFKYCSMAYLGMSLHDGLCASGSPDVLEPRETNLFIEQAIFNLSERCHVFKEGLERRSFEMPHILADKKVK